MLRSISLAAKGTVLAPPAPRSAPRVCLLEALNPILGNRRCFADHATLDRLGLAGADTLLDYRDMLELGRRVTIA